MFATKCLAQQCFKMAKLQSFKSAKVCVPSVRCYGSIYEPEYLDLLKPDIPEYEEVNIQIKGYDFAILESFQKLVHTIAENMDLEVSDGWALPPQTINVKRLVPNSENVEAQYTLNVYERNIQVVDIPTTKLSLLIEVIEDSLPAGVKASIHKHTDEHEILKYIPDNELKTLKNQLEEMGGSKKKK
ncbi:mitochondrial ribosomal protein L48 [Acyrthosiphon pisum]|uniref:Small ribosomal subunit protein uS10 domain-containing protein n=1 Tax=Acyrthosiphon pisum TaxID=7029 RepID=A0A8R1XHD4_ACYPI|nr:mitochondrial ribosomal protein L48 [Acyrthosiphon pisum]|eukprot:NP_001153816.1 mitochondrial ribosomal protein L48 [Acyrthosiphon pisum]